MSRRTADGLLASLRDQFPAADGWDQALDEGDRVSLSKPRTNSTPPGRKADAPAGAPAARQAPVPAQAGEHGAAAGRLRVVVERPEPGSVVIRVRGEVDLSSVPRLSELIGQRLTAAYLRTVVLDLSDVEFLSTSGLEMLLHAQRRAEARGVAVYVVPGGRCVQRLVELTDTGDRFCWRSSVAEAVAAAG